MSKLEKWQKQHRKIYELLLKNPRIDTVALSKEIGLTRQTVSSRLKHAFDKGFITTPQIRKKSFKNFKEYVYLINCQDPLEQFLQYIKNKDILCHAGMEGIPNFWVISKEKIDIEGDILVGGPRSDYHMTNPPEISCMTSVGNMNKRAEKFDPKDYQQKGTLETHWDETIEWSKEDEELFRELKYNLRRPLTPIIGKHRIYTEKAWAWLERLPECCSIITKYYPESRSAYDPYLYIFETDYEDFLIDLFSELPTSCLFFKVSGKLILYAHLCKELLGKGDLPISSIKELYIPLLIKELGKRGIVQSETHAIIKYYWIGDSSGLT